MPTYSKPQNNRRGARQTKGDMRSQARENVAQEYISGRRPNERVRPPSGGQVPFPRRTPQRPGVPPWAYQQPPAPPPAGPYGGINPGGMYGPMGGSPPMMSAPMTPMRPGQGGTFSPVPPPQYGPVPTQPPPIPSGGFQQGGPPMSMPPWMQQGGPMQGGAFQPPRIPQGGFGQGGGGMQPPSGPPQFGAMAPQPPRIPQGGFQYNANQSLGRLSPSSPAGTPPPPGSYDPNRSGGGWGGGFGY